MPPESLSPQNYDPFNSENLSCPHAAWNMLRQQSPVHEIKIPGVAAPVFFVSRKQDVEKVCRHPEIYSTRPLRSLWRWGELEPEIAAVFARGGYQIVHTFVTSDPPAHTRYRQVLNESLSNVKVRRMTPLIEGLIGELIGDLRSSHEVDLIARYAIPLPLRVIGAIMGLPPSEESFWRHFTDEFTLMVDPTHPLQVAVRAAETVRDAQRALADRIQFYRATAGQNLLSDFANARDPSGHLMSIEEALSMAMVTIIGGNETTRNGLGSVALALASDSALRAQLRENGDKIPIFIEEALRLEAPATTTARTVLQDTELGGTTVPKGAGLLVLWGSACRDEAAFRSPDKLDMTRSNARAHSAFGHGIHFCAGSQLARLELTLSVQHWLRDFETFELAVPESEVSYASVLGFRALPRLPVRLRPGEARSEIADYGGES